MAIVVEVKQEGVEIFSAYDGPEKLSQEDSMIAEFVRQYDNAKVTNSADGVTITGNPVELLALARAARQLAASVNW